MKNIYRIARLELANMFYSPIAWLLLIIFIIQNSLSFVDVLDRIESGQQFGQQTFGIASAVFTSRSGLYMDVLSKLYLYIPLLTMGLISRETSSGSIKLLLSSPIKIREIVWGKFLAMMVYGAMLMTILVVFVVTGGFSIENFDWSYILSGLLGIYLLICAYAAIGLFMSALTTYQVVAAISTLAVLALLNYIGEVWQRIDFVRDLTYFLSIAGRVEQMIKGLITTKDVLYFLIVITLFLGFTMLKLNAGREQGSLVLKVGRYIALTGVMLLIGYISSRPAFIGYYDATAAKRQTLTPASQAIIRQLKEPVRLTTYANLLDYNYDKAKPERRNTDARKFDLYTRFLPDMKMDYVYYYDQPWNSLDPDFKPKSPAEIRQRATVTAKAMRYNPDQFLSPAELRKTIDLRPENNLLVRKLEMGNQSSFLRIYQSIPQEPGEQEITIALKQLVTKPVRIAIVTGHNERSIASLRGGDYFNCMADKQKTHSLINQGFDPVELSLKKQAITNDIDIVVLADPKFALEPEELKKLQAYIDKGGNLLIAGEPGKQNVLAPITGPMGVSMLPGMLVQDSKKHAPDIVISTIDKTVSARLPAMTGLLTLAPEVELQGAAALQYKDSGQFHAFPVVTTQAGNTWNRLLPLNPDSVSISFSPQQGDQQGSFPVVLALTRKLGDKEQKIIVLGDADCMNNDKVFSFGASSPNQFFSTKLFQWLCDDRFPVEIRRPPLSDRKITIDAAAISRLRIMYIGILPAVLLVLGAFVLISRSRK